MKSINTMTLKANTLFSTPVYLEKDFILLCPEIPIPESLINRLKKWNYSVVYNEGGLQNTSQAESNIQNLAQIASLDKNIQQQEQEKEFLTFYQSLVQFTDTLFNNFVRKNSLDVEEITLKVKDTIEKLKKDKDMLLRLLTCKYTAENPYLPHSIHTMLLSLALGDFIKLPAHRMIELGLAAFLHEIGIFKIPNFLTLSHKEDLKEGLTIEEQKTLMAHTVLGYRLLKSYSLNENIALAALEHHEKWDGTGFPKKLKGETISIYARIIAVACYFESQFAQYLDNKQLFNFAEFIKTARTSSDEKILKALILCLSFYPLGSHVILNNGAKGIVYKANPENAQCPTVRLTVDKEGQPVNSHVLVEISQEKGVTISRLIPLEA